MWQLFGLSLLHKEIQIDDIQGALYFGHILFATPPTILLIAAVAAVVLLERVAPVHLCDALAVLAGESALLVVPSLGEVALLPADGGCLVGAVGAILRATICSFCSFYDFLHEKLIQAACPIWYETWVWQLCLDVPPC